MNIRFAGSERLIVVDRGRATTLCVENKTLYARIVASVLSNAGEQAIEPYVLWEGSRGNLVPKDVFLSVVDPFNLPWGHRLLSAGLLERAESYLYEDDDIRLMLERLNNQLQNKIAGLSLQMHSEYAFALEWSMLRYLKAFGYGIDLEEGQSLFDNIMKFVSYVADSSFKGVVVFVNLGTFLSINQVKQIHERVNFLNLTILFLENRYGKDVVACDEEYYIDQDLLEW